MDDVQKSLAEKRESTDASLGAERDSAVVANGAAARARRRALDLIERERLAVDARLQKFRDGADAQLAGERDERDEQSGSQPPRASVVWERAQTDEATRGERAVNDAILQQERERSDCAVHTRNEVDAHAVGAHRADTDEKLGAERLRVDGAVMLLGSTEVALSTAHEEIEHRGHVLAMVAHELRNPLTVIAMSTDFLAEGLVDPERVEAADEVQRSIARMQRLLMDLLDLARIEGGTLRITKRPVDVDALIREIDTAYAPLFTKRDVRFRCARPAAHAVVAFDHDRIVQVLSNLLTNAMKFTPAGGEVDLRVDLRADDIELAVVDTGAGIAPTALPSVFNRFWQASAEPGAGLGLGLHICENIVAAHAGRIWVESELGKGTAFRFTLPLVSPSP